MKKLKLAFVITISFLSLAACSASSKSSIGISCNPPNPANACYGG